MRKSRLLPDIFSAKQKQLLLGIWALACALLFGYHYSDTPLLGDAGAFAGIATHLVNGSALYTDVFENKGPGIFVLNALFIKLSGNNYSAIHLMQLLHVVAACFCIIRLFTLPAERAFWMPAMLLPWVLLRFSNGYCFFIGNYTEEYACYYLLYGMALVHAAADKPKVRFYFLLAGAALTQVIFIKETFAPLALTVALWAVFNQKKKFFVWIVAGAMVLMLGYLLYLLKNHALYGYFRYLQFAFGYAGGENAWGKYSSRLLQFYHDWKDIDPKLLWMAAGSLLVLADRKYLKKNAYLPLIFPIMAAISTLPLAMGKTPFGHYFLATVLFALLSGLGFARWLADKIYDLEILGNRVKWTLLIFGTLLIFPVTIKSMKHFTRKSDIAGSEKRERKQAIEKLMGYKTVFVDPQDAGRFYFYTGKSSGLVHPCTYYVYYQTETAGTFAEANRKVFLNSFLNQPPHCIVTEKEYGYGIQYAGLSEFVNINYVLKDSIEGADKRLYLIKVLNKK